MKLIIDSREQRPLPFPDGVFTETGSLYSGDYSIKGLESLFAVERKSLDDLAASCTRERERFERELHRLRGFRFKRLLIVGTRADLAAGRYYSKANPKAIAATLGAFEVRYDLPVVFVPTPEAGGRTVAAWAGWFTREMKQTFEAINKTEVRQ